MDELWALVIELRGVNAERRARNAEQAARIVEWERRLDADSSTSSKPPSSDSPYRKPGKQPGAPGVTMELVDNPDETVRCDRQCCGKCGTDLSEAPITGVTRRQVTDVGPPPPPRVTEYQIVTRTCPGCAEHCTAFAPACAPARASYGPAVLARAAELWCAYYLPVGRATGLMHSLVGVRVSTGYMAGVRHRAAVRLEQAFLPRVRAL